MTAEQWERVADLFDAVRSRPSAERAAWLHAEEVDPAVRREVAAMLAAEARSGGFLETPAAALAADLVDGAGLKPPGERVGPYRLVGEIGRGGMGVVYLAERADGAYEQRVAIKLLHTSRPSEDAAPDARFRAERQILAGLDHPHIARLLDGGTTDEGVAYLVMEHVDGRPLDAYCDAHRLGVHDRLRLFVDVCEAVEHAHRQLVVHRDLKPSNVLVTEEGRVKLLDFGIARLLHDDSTPGLTRTGLPLMTPEFASPEQVRGGAISTATDVYGLGLLLYVLFTGRSPHRFASRSLAEVARVVGTEEPVRPSAAVGLAAEGAASDAVAEARSATPERLRHLLRGDLDAIVETALRKEPSARYASAGALREDVVRYLEGRPVEARRGSAGYRARKFVRRQRGRVAAAAAVATLLVGLAGWYTTRITDERDRAAREAATSARVTAFLVDLFERADPYAVSPDSSTAAALAVLEPAASALEDALDEDPAVRAALLHTLGEVYANLGRPARAAALLEEAVALRRTLRDEAPGALAASLHTHGTVLGADLAQPDRAAALLEEAVALRRALRPGDPADLAESLLQHARFLPHDHPGKAARREEAFAMHRRLYGARGAEVGEALYTYYVMGYGSPDPGEVARGFREALGILTERVGPSLRTAIVMHDLGLVLDVSFGDPEGLDLLEASYAMSRSAAGPVHPETALMGINVGATLHEHGRYAEADTLLRAMLAVQREHDVGGGKGLVQVLYWHGRNLLALERPYEAEAVLHEAVDASEARAIPDDPRLPLSRFHHGRALAALGRHAAAARTLRAARDGLGALWGSEHPATQAAAAALDDLGRP